MIDKTKARKTIDMAIDALVGQLKIVLDIQGADKAGISTLNEAIDGFATLQAGVNGLICTLQPFSKIDGAANEDLRQLIEEAIAESNRKAVDDLQFGAANKHPESESPIELCAQEAMTAEERANLKRKQIAEGTYRACSVVKDPF